MSEVGPTWLLSLMAKGVNDGSLLVVNPASASACKSSGVSQSPYCTSPVSMAIRFVDDSRKMRQTTVSNMVMPFSGSNQ